jgi:hypothetical protein
MEVRVKCGTSEACGSCDVNALPEEVREKAKGEVEEMIGKGLGVSQSSELRMLDAVKAFLRIEMGGCEPNQQYSAQVLRGNKSTLGEV